MKYTVCVGVDGYVNMEVEATSLEDARKKAYAKVDEMDLDLEDIELRVAGYTKTEVK